MDSVEADGSSIDAAIENALKMLGTTRDRVEIEILTNAVRGVFGIGSRKARVRATVRAPIDTDHPVTPDRPRRAPVAEAPARAPTVEDRHGVERARQVVEDVLKHMDVHAEVNVSYTSEKVVFDLTGDSSGVLIGRRGQMLDALEYLLNRVAARDEGSSARIVVDSENYRARRQQALEELARRMAEQAKKKRKVVTLNPMSPRDRRIVHLILQDDTGLSTKSSGKGYFRKLIIIPAGVGKPRRDGGGEA